MTRTAVFAGHSGGHLFPAAAFAQNLRERFPESWIGLVTSRKGEPLILKLPAGLFDRVHYFPEFPFSFKLNWRSIGYFLRFLQAFALSFFYFRKNEIGLCAGFGSYISCPGVLTAKFLKIPTLIHEQNLIPGMATKMLVRHADAVAVSFEDTFKDLNLKNRVITGLPIRRQLKQAALNQFQSPQYAAVEQSQRLRNPEVEMFCILVIGGSQGAHRLNELVLESFSLLLPEEKQKIAVTHLTGKEDFTWVSKKYSDLGIRNEVFSFCDTMEQLYSKADMAITRAGANTLFELALFQLPAVVVPYPHAGAHQQANAAYFASRGAVILKEENTLTAAELLGQILKLKNNPEERRALSASMAGISHSDADSRLAETATNLARRTAHACH